MAKEILFLEKNGRTVAVPSKTYVTGTSLAASTEIDQGYGYIKIANNVIKDAIREDIKLLGCVMKSKGKSENKIYMSNPNKYNGYHAGSIYNGHRCSLICLDIVDSRYKAYQLISSNSETFIKLGEVVSYLNNSKGAKFEKGRHICKSSYIGVTAETPKILRYMSLNGNITPEELSKKIKGCEVHHVNADWDIRSESTMLISKQEHNKLHSKIGRSGHRVDVTINTVRELIAFLDFVESAEYKKLFI